jgi:hypothetical protein
MSWQIKLHDKKPEVTKIGDAWPYDTTNPNDPGYCIELPGGAFIDMNQIKEKWTVTGSLPNITVVPSINCIGRYHGFITDGIISDDCEGRKFQ